MAGKNIRSMSGKKGVGMSAPGRPKGMAGGGERVNSPKSMPVAPPTGMPKQTMPTAFSNAAKMPAKVLKKKGK